ncbi:hypothetical protein F6455_01060 [Proteobacteria bacterium 005FR1]|nr:hypothetical protein [Proteobacteria bacterium 005FR1]
MRPIDIPLLRHSSDLEDEVYLQMDKVLALCGMLSIADSNECDIPLGLRSNYSVVLEEQALALRRLLDRMFEQHRSV